MEIQVDFLGSNVDLKLVLIWFLFSHVGLRKGCKLFILKVRPVCGPYILSVKSRHASHYCFSIAKGLAMCRLGGVISAQKVLF